jgi:hypothetical protein
MLYTRRTFDPSIAVLFLASAIALAACGADRPVPNATYPPVPTFPVPAELLLSPIPEQPSGFGPATWAVDPDFPAPDPGTTTYSCGSARAQGARRQRAESPHRWSYSGQRT